MERNRYVLRDEYFGGTLYDRELLKHRFVGHDEINKGITINNKEIHNYEKWSADTSELKNGLIYSPTRIYFELTRECNLRCDHCFNSSGEPLPNEMTTDEMILTMEGLRKNNIFDLRFTGGELTVRPDWFILLNEAKKMGFTVSVNTNGVYKDLNDTVSKLASLDLNQITVSLDGDKEHHENIRGKNTFDKTLKTLKVLKQLGATLRTNTVINTLSVDDAEKIISIVSPYVSEVAFFHMRMTGRAQNILDKSTSFDELYEFNLQMENIRKKYPDINMFFGELAMLVNSTINNKFDLKFGGPDGFTRFNILADGSIWAGGYVPYIDPSLNLGNIKDNNYDILDIWRNSPILNKYRDWSGTLIDRCLECPEFSKKCPGVNVEMEMIRKNFPDIGNPYCIY